MLPVTSVIPAPIPEHLLIDHDPGMVLAALLLVFVISAVVALLSAASADRAARAADDLRFLEEFERRGAALPARPAKAKRRVLAA